LPGYGYAKVPVEMRKQWQGLIEGYFQRPCISCAVCLFDGRREPDDLDRALLEWLMSRRITVFPVATKMDRISMNKRKPVITAMARHLGVEPNLIFPLSAVEGFGVERLGRQILAALEQTRKSLSKER
jgi:GTP-binding protein